MIWRFALSYLFALLLIMVGLRSLFSLFDTRQTVDDRFIATFIAVFTLIGAFLITFDPGVLWR
jgi:uncharacterized membrane protein HdeD (DUF308 family)